jgi:hypothetical protein
MSPAEKLALAMEQDFKKNGYDVEVRASSEEKAIILTSDLFKDPEWREAEVTKLTEDRKVFCGLGIWYAKVGYSKGIFSSDIMKTVSLRCPAEKAAHAEELAAQRRQFAGKLAPDLRSLNVHSSVAGTGATTLILECDDWTVAQAPAFGRALLQSPAFHDLCRLGFAQVQLRNNKLLLKTIPLTCR